MFFSVHARRAQFLTLALISTLALLLTLAVTPQAQADASTGSGGLFVPLTGRLLATAAGGSKMTPNQWLSVAVEGVAGVPATGVSAVQVTFSAVNHTDAGKLYADKTGVATPNTSVPALVYTAAAVSNSAIVPVGADGSIQIMTTGVTDVIIDMGGYYTAGTTASGGYVPLSPTNLSSVPSTTLTAGQSLTFSVSSVVPSNASAVMLDVLEYSKDSTANAWATAGPAGTSASSVQMNWPAGQNYVWTSVVSLPASANRQVTISMGPRGSASFVVGIEGYFNATTTSTPNGAFIPGQTTVVDTRSPSNPIASGGALRNVQVAGVNGVPAMSSGITSVAVNLEIYPAAGSYQGGHVQLFADDVATGTTSVSQAFNQGQPLSVFEVVKLGADGGINIQNSYGGTLNVVLDIEGWFGTPAAPTLTCASPYTNGSWTTALPTAATSCTLSSPAALESGTLELDDNGTLIDAADLSSSAANNATFNFTPVAGQNAMAAVVTDVNGNAVTSSSLSFGVGDWSTDTLIPSPADGSTTILTPQLNVQPTNDAFSADVGITYTVFADAAGSVAVYSAAATDGSLSIPSGILGPTTTYYWSATLTGTAGGRSTPTTITSPIYSLTTQTAAQGDPDGIGFEILPGDTLTNVVDNAVTAQGNQAVADELAALANTENSGQDTGFAPITGESQSQAATDLQAQANRILGTQTYDPVSGSSWNQYVARAVQLGYPVAARRAWYFNSENYPGYTTILHQTCNEAGTSCYVDDRYTVTFTFNLNLRYGNATVTVKHPIQKKNSIGGVNFDARVYRNQSEDGHLGQRTLRVGANTIRFDYTTSLKGNNATLWFFLQQVKFPAKQLGMRSSTAACNNDWCSY